jgi:hypothetical protein
MHQPPLLVFGVDPWYIPSCKAPDQLRKKCQPKTSRACSSASFIPGDSEMGTSCKTLRLRHIREASNVLFGVSIITMKHSYTEPTSIEYSEQTCARSGLRTSGISRSRQILPNSSKQNDAPRAERWEIVVAVRFRAIKLQ